MIFLIYRTVFFENHTIFLENRIIFSPKMPTAMMQLIVIYYAH
jgi:hypothetical protein